MAETASNRIVITVLGENRPGIVAGVTRVLGEANVDIRDITDLQEALVQAGELSGVTVNIQREDVFNFMYRL